MPHPITTSGPIAAVADFSVIDETDDWLVVAKPAPLVVHPTGKKHEITLLDGVRALLAFELANGARLAMINRLDRETSGIVLFAKNPTWARIFGRAMERRQFNKHYLAWVHGHPSQRTFTCKQPILRAGSLPKSPPQPIYVRQIVHPEGRPSHTNFQLVATSQHPALGDIALLKASPITGRMHQIRVHLAHLGHPILGDKIYSTPNGQAYLDFTQYGFAASSVQALPLPRHALHAAQLSINLPEINATWHSRPTPELTRLIPYPA